MLEEFALVAPFPLASCLSPGNGVVIKEFGIKREKLHFHGRRAGVVKGVALELCCLLTGKSQREIARYFGYGNESSIGKQRNALVNRLKEDKVLTKRVAKLKKRLK